MDSLIILKIMGLLRCCGWGVSLGGWDGGWVLWAYASLFGHGLVEQDEEVERPLDRGEGVGGDVAVGDRPDLERLGRDHGFGDRLGNLGLEEGVGKRPEMLGQQPGRELPAAAHKRRLVFVVLREQVLVGDPADQVADGLQVAGLQDRLQVGGDGGDVGPGEHGALGLEHRECRAGVGRVMRVDGKEAAEEGGLVVRALEALLDKVARGRLDRLFGFRLEDVEIVLDDGLEIPLSRSPVRVEQVAGRVGVDVGVGGRGRLAVGSVGTAHHRLHVWNQRVRLEHHLLEAPVGERVAGRLGLGGRDLAGYLGRRLVQVVDEAHLEQVQCLGEQGRVAREVRLGVAV